MIGGFLKDREGLSDGGQGQSRPYLRQRRDPHGTGQIHTVRPLDVRFPKGKLSVVSGVSGSGKTTMILESLIPALRNHIDGQTLPPHVSYVEAEGIRQVKLIDATPIGINIRSTVAPTPMCTMNCGRYIARTDEAKANGLKAGDFSYNTGNRKLRCPTCDGTGTISLDVQFLPDVTFPAPTAGAHATQRRRTRSDAKGKAAGAFPSPTLMSYSVDEALSACDDLGTVRKRLSVSA
jgi:excinuclease ABC subunit A